MSCADQEILRSTKNPVANGRSTPDETDHQKPCLATIERLGRSRPSQMENVWIEAGLVFSVTLSQLLSEYFTSGYTVLAPRIAQELVLTEHASTWPTSAFCLAVSAFILPFGRMADIFGPFPFYVAGSAWSCAWSVGAGFSRSEATLDLCRAMQGLGTAASLPSGLTLLGVAYRPGPRKNMVFSLYGAMAPLGFFCGVLSAGSVSEYATWPWYFWIGAMIYAINVVVSCVLRRALLSTSTHNNESMDWLGSICISAGIILVVFAITDGAYATDGWRTPYILVTAICGVGALLLAIFIEGWVARDPLLPLAMFRIKYIRPLLLVLLFAYGTIGIFILYSNLYIQNIMRIEPITVVAWYAPMAIAGFLFAILGGAILHIVPATAMLLASGVATIVSALLLALMPAEANYWAWILPATVSATFSIDVLFNVVNIFLSTSLPSRRQGLAGAMANLLLYLSISLHLGFAEIIATTTAADGLEQSYRNVFWLELACGAVGLLICLFFVRLGNAPSDLTCDEKQCMENGTLSSSEALQSI